jgi:LPXTG-motif cell wall-anchored protein
MSRSVRVICAGALMGLGLWAAPAGADPAYPPTGPGGGGGGTVVVPPTGGGGGTVTPPTGGGGGGTVLPQTGQDIRNQAVLGLGVGLLGSALVLVAAKRRRLQPVLA